MKFMSIEEAIETIRNPNSTFVEQVNAADTLAQSPDTPLEYLLECLRRKGLPAETAAMRLYIKTKRPQIPPDITGFVSDYDDWRSYLRQRNLIP